MKRVLHAAGIAVLIALAPAAAIAVSVSSSNGTGTGVLTYMNSVGYAQSNGSVRSSTGHPVYIDADVVYNQEKDQGCAQHVTPDRTSSTTAYYYNRPCDYLYYEYYSPTGMNYDHCRNINNWPDSCGSWVFDPR